MNIEQRNSILAMATFRARNSRVASACVAAENTSLQLCERVKAETHQRRENRLAWRLLRLTNAKSSVSSSFMPWQSRVI